MKAYRGEDGRIRLFRPDRNMARMLNTAKRASLPAFDADEMIKCIKKLVQIDKEWIPHSTTSSLYIRPTFIATDVSLTCFPSTLKQCYLQFFPYRFVPQIFSLLWELLVRIRRYYT